MLSATFQDEIPGTDTEGVRVATGEGMPHLAEKLNHLFATVPAPTRSGLYSNETAAQALAELGVTVSGVHLSHLRAGRRDNPSARLLAAIGELFGVPIGYFFDDTLEKQITSELDALTAIRDDRARSLMVRAQGVSPQSMEQLEAMLDRIRVLEGLDRDEDDRNTAPQRRGRSRAATPPG